MKNIIVGTAGHVDHGKTQLIKALTGTDTDRLKEEKKRGITIELGFTNMPNDSEFNVGIIDVPGHEKFIKNMLAGIGGVDIALLVVAADEGVMPQTREHFEILKTLDIKWGIVAVTKDDLVDEEWLEIVHEDINELCRDTFLEQAEKIDVSAYTGHNIEYLKDDICKLGTKCRQRSETPEFLRIPVDRVFTMTGFGTVITGTLIEGTVTAGEEVMLYPSETVAKVRNIQVHGQNAEKAYAGQRTAINFSNIKKSEIHKGDIIARKGALKPSNMLDVKVKIFDDCKRIVENGSRVHLHYGSSETLCKIVLLDKENLTKGEYGYAQLRLENPLAAKTGDNFIIRFYSPLETMGGGVILDATPSKHKRFNMKVIEALEIKASEDKDAIAEQLIYEKGTKIKTPEEISMILGIEKAEIKEIINSLTDKGRVKVIDGQPLHTEYIKFVVELAEKLLMEHHASNPLSLGMRKEEFKKKLDAKVHVEDAKDINLLFNHIVDNDLVKQNAGMISTNSFEVEYSSEQQKTMTDIEKKHIEHGYEPPAIDEIIQKYKKSTEARDLIYAMVAEGKLKFLNPEYCIHMDNWNKAVDLLEEHVKRNGQITLAEFRDMLKTSRKYAVMILDRCDEEDITKMIGDARVLVERKQDGF